MSSSVSQMKNRDPIQVLVVDDTVTYRMILSSVVKELEAMTLCGTAKNGQEALQALDRNPADLVLLDVEMPVMDGLQTLDAILKQHPETGVVLISGKTTRSAESTIQALQNGALDFITKPDCGSSHENMQVLRQNLENIAKLYSCRHRLPHASGKPQGAGQNKEIEKPACGVDIVVIGTSTGGPNALVELVSGLPEDLGVPVLVVQHMPPLFTASLAKSLNTKSALTVKEAAHGEAILPGIVYIAPGGKHMEIEMTNQVLKDARIRLTEAPPENSCRPSVDVLFRSAAKYYGKNILAVIMTGMGSDGLEGVRLIKGQGGYCITQTEASCVVYGMPRAVDEKGLSDKKVPLEQLAHHITERVRQGHR